MRSFKYAVGLAVLALVSYGIFVSNQHALTDAQKLDRALIQLLKDSPSTLELWKHLGAPTSVIQAVDLHGADLGTTTVFEDGTFQIRVDVEAIRLKHDRLEPVLAHEIYHAWDAQKKGPGSFIATVLAEKPNIAWWNRSFEKPAVAWENKVRAELKQLNPPEYATMPATRELANAR